MPPGDIMSALDARTPARQRGSVDRIFSRKQIEQAFIETFELVGGVPRLAQWANDPENYTQFLKLLMQLAPKEQMQEAVGNVIEYRSNVPQSPLNRTAPPPPVDPTEPVDADFTVVPQ